MTAYRIVRRAYSKFTEIEVVEGWLAAELRAMELQAANQDGEYLTRKIGEEYNRPANPSYQSGFDYL